VERHGNEPRTRQGGSVAPSEGGEHEHGAGIGYHSAAFCLSINRWHVKQKVRLIDKSPR
jgi:hypothetical protein